MEESESDSEPVLVAAAPQRAQGISLVCVKYIHCVAFALLYVRVSPYRSADSLAFKWFNASLRVNANLGLHWRW